ncbi:elongation of very long chain fatty acids protein 7-like [Bradysia coprophila]|uniref:elongation of very long chain fatty acids protein 7-like n=1 Tax=Bradysia coprophila TaxID=38358 RepID=UPI00187D72A2|nr:elongation of very long chain fatty acids protein 7-like [Bradysia coprophila]
MITNFLTLPELWTKGKSPLLDSWPLYGDPSSVALILAAYIAFVLYLGPLFMKNRQPFNLKNVIILYNALQVFYNFWVLARPALEPCAWKYFFSFGCAEMTPQQERDYEMLICVTFWHMTVNKIMDLLDTVFFVLCKKQNHISFLHVQHHVLSVAILWIVGKYFTGQELTVTFGCNTIVHMIMYFYYLVAALGPAYKKYLWWKKYLTMLQISQFLIIIVYMLASLWLSCGYNPAIVWLIILNASLNLALFLKFYFNTYDSKKLISDKIAVCSSLQFSSNYTENQQIEKSDINENCKKEM